MRLFAFLGLLALAYPCNATDPPGLLARHGDSRLRHGSTVDFYAFSPDSQTLVTASDSLGTLKLWDVGTGKLKKTLQVLPDAAVDSITAMAFDSTGRLRVVYQNSQSQMTEVITIHPVSGEKVNTVFLAETNGYHAVLDPLGLWVYIPKEDQVEKFSLETGAMVGRLSARVQVLGQMTVSPDGKLLAVQDKKSAVKVLDTVTGMERYRKPPSKQEFHWMQFTYDSSGLMDFTSNVPPKLWDLATGENRFDSRAMKTFNHSNYQMRPQPLLLSSHGFLLFTDDGKLELRNFIAGRLEKTWNLKSTEIQNITLAPDNRTLGVLLNNGSIRFYDLVDRKYLPQSATWINDLNNVRSPSRGVMMSYDINSNQLQRWDINKSAKPTIVNLTKKYGSVADINTDGNEVLTADLNGLFIHDAITTKLKKKITFNTKAKVGAGIDTSGISSIFLGRGEVIAIPQEKGFAEFYHRGTDKKVKAKGYPQNTRNAMAVHTQDPDIAVFIAFKDMNEDESDLLVLRFNTHSGELISSLKLGADTRWAVSPDGRKVAVTDQTCFAVNSLLADQPRIVRVYDIENGSLLLTKTILSNYPASMKFSPDGRSIVMVNDKNHVDLFETATLTLRSRFRLIVDNIFGDLNYAFSPDGLELYTPTMLDPVLVWDVRGLKTSPDPLPKEYTAKQAWEDLGHEDGTRGYRGVRYFANHPPEALEKLKKAIPLVKPVEFAVVQRHCEGWTSPSFVEREEATRAVKALGKNAMVHLQAILKLSKEPEVQARAKAILQDLVGLTKEDILAIRAVEVLDWIHSDEAKELLKMWASGEAQAELTREAKATLKRWSK